MLNCVDKRPGSWAIVSGRSCGRKEKNAEQRFVSPGAKNRNRNDSGHADDDDDEYEMGIDFSLEWTGNTALAAGGGGLVLKGDDRCCLESQGTVGPLTY